MASHPLFLGLALTAAMALWQRAFTPYAARDHHDGPNYRSLAVEDRPSAVH